MEHVRGEKDDLYALLGINQKNHNVSQREIRKAYLHAIIEEHPDKGGNSEKFTAIQQAYAVLSDAPQRVIYDEQLERGRDSVQNRESSIQNSTHVGLNSMTNTWQNSVQQDRGFSVFVHGQTGGRRPQPRNPPPGEACAGQRWSHANDVIMISTDRIDELRRAMQCDLGEGKEADLAVAYVERGAAHIDAGRPHHAAFDAEEALQLCPESESAKELLRMAQDLCTADASPTASSQSSDS